MKILLLKYGLIAGIVFINMSGLSAQTKTLNLKEIGWHIGDGLSKNYHPDSLALSKLCRLSCVFIKFKVDQKGQIVTLSFSKETTYPTKDSISFIKESLTKAVYSLQKDNELIETLKRSGKIIIQPVIYIYQGGCGFPKSAQLSEVIKEEEERKKNNIHPRPYNETLADMNLLSSSIANMLNFEDGKMQTVDCLLLNPVWLANGSIE